MSKRDQEKKKASSKTANHDHNNRKQALGPNTERYCRFLRRDIPRLRTEKPI